MTAFQAHKIAVRKKTTTVAVSTTHGSFLLTNINRVSTIQSDSSNVIVNLPE